MLLKKLLLLLLCIGCYHLMLQGQIIQSKAKAFILAKAEANDYNRNDIGDIRITDMHKSTLSGLYHVYFQQYVHQLPVEDGRASVHISASEEIIHYHQNFVKNIAVFPTENSFSVSEEEALQIALEQLKMTKPQSSEHNLHKQTEKAKLTYVKSANEQYVLAWELMLEADDFGKAWMIWIDAQNGQEIKKESLQVKCHFGHRSSSKNTKEDKKCVTVLKRDQPNFWDSNCVNSFDGQYNAFHYPLESPLYGGRSLKSGLEIINGTASPNGWHTENGITYNYTRGNNTYAAYLPAGPPVLGLPIASPITRDPVTGTYLSGNVPQPADNLNFNYSNDLETITATSFLEDAITNAFVWGNICHDVFHLYGFDEAAGNFQAYNITGNGQGNDLVLIGTQDGTNINQAAFTRAVEGEAPYMKLHLWNTAVPDKVLDTDFDNLVIAHEYGHGVTGRLLGGANTVSCFGGIEHGDEGWSDFFGLLLTMQDISGNGNLDELIVGEGIRGIGNYLKNDGVGECASANADASCGLRPTAYSTSMAINPYTYGDITGMAVPHGVGFVWCTILWEMTWKLINEHGFEANLYATNSAKGNIVAMKLVMEGLKMTPCGNTQLDFIEMRDAILAADTALFAGANSNLLWEAFAKRGLGISASSGGQESFDLPTIYTTKTVNKEEMEIGESIIYQINVKNNSSESLSNVQITDDVSPNLSVSNLGGGSLANGTITWNIGGLSPNSSTSVSFTATTANGLSGTTIVQENDLETAIIEFIPLGLWQWVDNASDDAKNGDRFFEHAGYPTPTEGSLLLTLNLDATDNNHLSFWQNLDTEAGYDGGVIEIFQGGEWQDIGDRLAKNSYNGGLSGRLPIGISTSTLDGRRAFTGQSDSYFNTIIDLTGLSGAVQLRFRFATDSSNDAYTGNNPVLPFGWRLDDFKLLDLVHIPNEACATDQVTNVTDCGDVGQIGTIIYEAGALPVEWLDVVARPQDEHIQVQWTTMNEINNRGFSIERKSNSQNWQEVSWEPASTSNHQMKTYSFLDTHIKSNTVYYYRIKQIDFNDQYSYSPLVSAIVENQVIDYKVFPNPVTDNLTIQFSEEIMEEGWIKIYSLDGKLMKATPILYQKQYYSIPCSHLSANIYTLMISTPRIFSTRKVMIK